MRSIFMAESKVSLKVLIYLGCNTCGVRNAFTNFQMVAEMRFLLKNEFLLFLTPNPSELAETF